MDDRLNNIMLDISNHLNDIKISHVELVQVISESFDEVCNRLYEIEKSISRIKKEIKKDYGRTQL